MLSWPKGGNISPSILNLKDVTKAFVNAANYRVTALRNVSLSAKGGEVIALIGPSGCGKSTLLRIIAGLEMPDSGTLHRGSSELGFVFQDPLLLPWRNIYDNVSLPRRILGEPQSLWQKDVDISLKQLGLYERKLDFPHMLSGGMKMRASLARALIKKPELLLLDEPFAALDEFMRASFCDLLLKTKNERQQTMIFVTHSIADAAHLADTVYIMGSAQILHREDVVYKGERSKSLRFTREFLEVCEKLANELQKGEER